MSTITFTMNDWHKLCAAFNVTSAELFRVLETEEPRAPLARESVEAAAFSAAVADTDDGASVASSTISDQFANKKARAFALSNGIAASSVSGRMTGFSSWMNMVTAAVADPAR